MHGNSLIVDFAVVFGVAAIIMVLTQKLKLPTILGYILAGIIVGPYLPVPLFADKERIDQISELGVILVMFSIGLEFNIKKFITILPNVGIAAGIQMITLFLVGTVCGQLFGWGFSSSLILGAALSISSTVISNKSMEVTKVSSGVKEYVYGILVVQDIVGILIITVLSTIIAGGAVEFKLLGATAYRMLLFIIALLGIGILIVPRITQVVLRFNSRETIIILACGVCFSFSYFADHFGYSVALGAFIGGMLISESGRGRYFDENITQIKSMFAAMFFISVGMSLDPRVFIGNIHFSLILSFVIVTLMLGSIILGGILSGYGMKTSVISGLALGQIGEFTFIISSLALSAKLVSIDFYSTIVSTSAITAVTTQLLLNRHEKIFERIDSFLPDRFKALIIIYLNWLNTAKDKSQERGGETTSYLGKILMYSVVMILLSSAMTVASPYLGKLVVGLKIPVVSSKHIYPLFELLIILPFLILMLLSASNLLKKLTNEHIYNLDGKVTFLKLAKFSVSLFVLFMLTLVLMIVTLPLGKISFLSFGLMFLVMVLFSYVVWRKSSEIQDQLENSLERFFRSFFLGHRGTGFKSVDITSRFLPNLEDVNVVNIRSGSQVVGVTIRDLNLRGKTGATILSIVRGYNHIYLPDAEEVLKVGDLVALVGGEESIDRAIELLLKEKKELQP